MQIEDVYLNMSQLGLGDLNEYALMVMFGNAHSHHLTQGLDITPNEIVAANGTTLYPAYFMTHLKVPLTALLNNYQLWQTVTVATDVKRFGETLLESQYILARQGQLNDDVESWQDSDCPTMLGNNLIVAEEMNSATAKRQVLNPAADKIAELPRARRSPAGIASSRKLRAQDLLSLETNQFRNQQPYVYEIKNGRDAVPGHAMIFAKFCEILDIAEYDYLSNQLKPGFADNLLHRLNVVEREIYYYGNCYSGEELDIYLAGSFESLDTDDFDEELDFIPAAYLHINFEVYQKRTNTLIALSKTKKVFAVPMMEQDNIPDLLRKIAQLNVRQKI